jgi:type I restriction enzyme, S subunit
MIPNGWRNSTIGELIDFSGGSQPPKNTFSFEPLDGYVRLIQIRDYKTDKYATYVPKRLAKKFCDSEDIMIGRYGPPIFQILRGINGAYNVALIKATPSKKLMREYMYYFLSQGCLQEFITGLSQRTSGQTGIEMDQLKSYPLPLPPLLEQCKIVEILGVWDESIDLLEKLITAKHKLKQGLRQKLLTGKKRFREFLGNSAAGIKNDKLPEGWLSSPIGDICHSIVPGRNKPKQFDGDIPWVTTPNITQKYISKNSVNLFVSEKEINSCGGKIVPQGSVIINCVGDFGIIGIAKQRIVINQQLHAFVCSEELNNEYIFYALSIQTHHMLKMATTTTIPYMNKSSCESIPVLLPPLAEQEKIAAVLSAADAEIATLEKQLAAYKQQKRGLMQQLLTGRTRILGLEDGQD